MSIDLPFNTAHQSCHHRQIHAPAWGATREPQPVHHADPVSIHAPAWGATLEVRHARLDLDVSIHAPAWGATTELDLIPATH